MWVAMPHGSHAAGQVSVASLPSLDSTDKHNVNKSIDLPLSLDSKHQTCQWIDDSTNNDKHTHLMRHIITYTNRHINTTIYEKMV